MLKGELEVKKRRKEKERNMVDFGRSGKGKDKSKRETMQEKCREERRTV